MSENIAYNTYAMLRDCRLRYKFTKVEKREGSPASKDKRNAIFGFIIQKMTERFYTEGWFKLGKGATQKMFDMLPEVMKEQIAKNPCAWEHQSEVELLERDCQDSIRKFIQVVKEERLLGEKNESEKPIEHMLTKRFRLTGRIDFLFHRGSDVILLDGKGTKHGKKYLDEEQLLYYVLVLQLNKCRIPNKVGFLMFREARVMWMPWGKDEMLVKVDELFTRIKEGLFHLQKEDYTASPSYKACRFCPYKEYGCKDYIEWHRKNQKAQPSLVEVSGTSEDGILEVV